MTVPTYLMNECLSPERVKHHETARSDERRGWEEMAA